MAFGRRLCSEGHSLLREPQTPMSTWTCLLTLPADTHVPVDMPVSGTAGTHVHGDMPARASRRYPCPQGHDPLREPQTPMYPGTCLFAVPADTHVPGDMPVSGAAGTHVHVDTPVRASRGYPCPQVHAPLRFQKKVEETVQVICNQRNTSAAGLFGVFGFYPGSASERRNSRRYEDSTLVLS